MPIEEYIASNGNKCPFCKEGLVFADDTISQDNGKVAHQSVHCESCKTSWNDVWHLVGIDNIVSFPC
jgi:C4-type Zn-finger protein